MLKKHKNKNKEKTGNQTQEPVAEPFETHGVGAGTPIIEKQGSREDIYEEESPSNDEFELDSPALSNYEDSFHDVPISPSSLIEEEEPVRKNIPPAPLTEQDEVERMSSESDSEEEQTPEVKARKSQRCDCINSALFPHIREKCLLRKKKKQKSKEKKTGAENSSRQSQSLGNENQSFLSPSTPQSASSDPRANVFEQDGVEEDNLAGHSKLKGQQCDCINSALFPHRREKCLLRKHKGGKGSKSEREASGGSSDQGGSHNFSKSLLRSGASTETTAMSSEDSSVSQIDLFQEGELEAYMFDMFSPSDSDSESDSESESDEEKDQDEDRLQVPSDGTPASAPVEKKRQRKQKKNEKCDCINSKVFPHRRQKCFLRSKCASVTKKISSRLGLRRDDDDADASSDSDDEAEAEDGESGDSSFASSFSLKNKHVEFVGMTVVALLFALFLSDLTGLCSY
jgi:hypothetical protein